MKKEEVEKLFDMLDNVFNNINSKNKSTGTGLHFGYKLNVVPANQVCKKETNIRGRKSSLFHFPGKRRERKEGKEGKEAWGTEGKKEGRKKRGEFSLLEACSI